MVSARAVPEDLTSPAVEIKWKSVSLGVWLHVIAVSSGLMLLKSPFQGGGREGNDHLLACPIFNIWLMKRDEILMLIPHPPE